MVNFVGYQDHINCVRLQVMKDCNVFSINNVTLLLNAECYSYETQFCLISPKGSIYVRNVQKMPTESNINKK